MTTNAVARPCILTYEASVCDRFADVMRASTSSNRALTMASSGRRDVRSTSCPNSGLPCAPQTNKKTNQRIGLVRCFKDVSINAGLRMRDDRRHHGISGYVRDRPKHIKDSIDPQNKRYALSGYVHRF